jgi:hypothetical protein
LAVYTQRNRFDSQTEQFHEADADQEPCDLVIFGVHAMIPKSLFDRRATAGDRPGFAMLHPPLRSSSPHLQDSSSQSSPANPLPIAFFRAEFRCRQARLHRNQDFDIQQFSSFQGGSLELETRFSAAVSETRRRKLTGNDRNGRNE